MADLLKQFDQAMLTIYQRAKSETKYKAAIFFRMLNERGGLATAKYLINSERPSEGYTHLYERGRLDLTVEAMVVEEPRWHSLFSAEELASAKKRLEARPFRTGSTRRLRSPSTWLGDPPRVVLATRSRRRSRVLGRVPLMHRIAGFCDGAQDETALSSARIPWPTGETSRLLFRWPAATYIVAR